MRSYRRAMVAMALGCVGVIASAPAMALDIGGRNGVSIGGNGSGGLGVSVGGSSGVNAAWEAVPQADWVSTLRLAGQGESIATQRSAVAAGSALEPEPVSVAPAGSMRMSVPGSAVRTLLPQTLMPRGAVLRGVALTWMPR